MRGLAWFGRAGLLACLLLLGSAGAALAGDGGTVTVDAPPMPPAVGVPLTIRFVVYTHGQPIDRFGDRPVRPFLTATNRATGGSLRAEGRKDGDLGRFAVDVTFPSAGEWDLRIKAEPLMLGTWTGTTIVGPAAVAPAPASAAAGGGLGGAFARGARAALALLSP